MTLAELIADVNELRPNQFTAEQMTGWVNEVERKAVEQVINRALGNDVEFTPYNYAESDTATLMIPDEHKDVYVTWLFAKMDYINAEIDRYNADATMHNAAWKSYAADYRRNHYPKPVESMGGLPDPMKGRVLSAVFVPVLPDVGADATLYFVMEGDDIDHKYTQYLYRNGAWIRVGGTSVDLSRYWSKDELTPINTGGI